MLRLALASALSLACVTVTHAFDKPEYQNLDPKVRDWFKSVRSPHGVPCCDIADGHRTDYEMRTDGYWVPIGGEMRHVSPEAIVYNAGNPVGEAVVWYVMTYPNASAPVPFIRCFVPGGGV